MAIVPFLSPDEKWAIRVFSESRRWLASRRLARRSFLFSLLSLFFQWLLASLPLQIRRLVGSSGSLVSSAPDPEVLRQNIDLEVKLQSSSVPASIPSASVPSYAARFKSSLRNLRKISDPSFLEDGTPVVQAPSSVLLETSDLWKDHVVAHFHGRMPPAGKIIADLNPVWGKFGKITVRTVSATCCLIYIPSVQTREWVLQVGYWQADRCAFSVYPWSSDGNLAAQELLFAPTWAVLKNVPPQLYSLDGISVVASGIGDPLHTEKSRLDPYHFGDTKVKVEIDLSQTPPEVVEVRDSQGNSVRINVEYPSLPPKCINYGKFGHLINRCHKPLMKKEHSQKKQTVISIVKAAEDLSLVEASNEDKKVDQVDKKEKEAQIEVPVMEKGKSRSRARRRSRSRAKARALSSPPEALVVVPEDQERKEQEVSFVGVQDRGLKNKKSVEGDREEEDKVQEEVNQKLDWGEQVQEDSE